jgi:wobble nucleotide-excising tRNase
MNENENLMQMMRLVLEQVQNMNERINQLPTRDELLAVQQTAVSVEDRSETGYILLNSQHNRIENSVNELGSTMAEGFQTTADTLQEIFILNKSLVDKVNDLDDDVKDLQRKIG